MFAAFVFLGIWIAFLLLFVVVVVTGVLFVCVCVVGGGGLNLRAKVLFGRHVFPCLRKHYSEVDLHLVSAYHATTGQFLECLVDCVFWVLTQCGIHLVVATELV